MVCILVSLVTEAPSLLSIASIREHRFFRSAFISTVILAAVKDKPRSSISENLKNIEAESKGRSKCCTVKTFLLFCCAGPASIGDSSRSSIVCPIRDSMNVGGSGMGMWILTWAIG